MKKFITVAFLCAVFSGSLIYAQENLETEPVADLSAAEVTSTVKIDEPVVVTTSAEVLQATETQSLYFTVDALIRDGLFENQAQIMTEAMGLSVGEKLALFNQHSKTTGIPTFFNLFIGFGIGSLIQGDEVGFSTIAVTEAITLGATLGVTGYLAYISFRLSEQAQNYPDGNLPEELLMAYTRKIAIAGGICLVAGLVETGVRVYSAYRPGVYAREYNDALRNCLLVGSASVNLIPLVDPVDQQYGFIASVKF